MFEDIPQEWNVFPIKKNQKAPPLYKEWQNERYPRDKIKTHTGNFALACGEISGGVIIIDLDFRLGRKGNIETIFEDFNKHYPKLANTKVVESPHGYHFYYNLKDNKGINNTGKKNCNYTKKGFIPQNKTKYGKWLSGVDTRANGGYVVMAPSTVDGFEYRVTNNNKKIPTLDVTRKEYQQIIAFFNLEKEKIAANTIRKGFIDILEGKIEPDAYANTIDVKKHVLWKETYHEVYAITGLEPEELFEGLVKNNKGFNLEKAKEQTQNTKARSYITDGTRLSKEKYDMYFSNHKIAPLKTALTTKQNIPKKLVSLEHWELVNWILEKYNIQTSRETDIMAIYKAGVYYKDEKNSTVRSILQDFYQTNAEKISIQKRNALIESIKALTFYDEADFNPNEYLVNLKNGIYDLKNDTFTAHKDMALPYKTFVQLPVVYNPEAKCPVYEKFLIDVFGKDRLDLMYQVIAYAMISTVKYQKSIMLYGEGANGKGIFLMSLIEFLGNINTTQIPLHVLSKNFQTYGLKGKLANIVPDLDDAPLKRTGVFKTLADKYLESEKKNVNERQKILNACLQLFSCNKLMEVKDETDGFWRRWVLIACHTKFVRREELEKGDTNLKLKDPNILSKIIMEGEFSGLFNKAIEGWKALEAMKGFPKEWDNEEKVKDIWNTESDPLKLFVKTKCVLGDSYSVDKKEIYDAFCDFRKEKKLDVLGISWFTKHIKKFKVSAPIRVSQKSHPGSSGRKYNGIKLGYNEEDGNALRIFNEMLN